MNIGIVVFAYNRSEHLKQVLETLKHNQGVNKIYVFQDGLKEEIHREEWEKTIAVIRNVDWCEVDYFLSEYNKGLRKSILDGVNYVFHENDAVVVLEDDCVVTANFMSFMRQGLEMYKESEQVYSVSGHAWPIEVENKIGDAYFCGRISSWGWGTWKDRWEKLELDYELVKEIKCATDISEQLALWGNDLEDILVGNVKGNTDSWAVFWALSVIKQKGLCLNPYYALVKNIGFDGSGVHCGTDEISVAEVMDGQREVFVLPEELIIYDDVKKAFSSKFGGVYKEKNSEQKEKVIVYGMGNYYARNEKKINEQYDVVMYIDQAKNGYYAGTKIGKKENINEMKYDKILVMIANLNEVYKVIYELHDKYAVPYEKIELGYEVFEKEESLISGIDKDGKIRINAKGHEFKVGSFDEYENVKEVFKNDIYQYRINNQKKDIVFDVGGSIGDSALYFLTLSNVEKVYMYEPFPDTYTRARENLLDFCDTERLEMNLYGISDVSEQRQIVYNANMSCGQSTIIDIRQKAKNIYIGMGLIRESDEQSQIIEVRRATEVFEPLVKKHAGNNLILKMDCEGEEYNIFKDLSESGILSQFHFIMLEWHYQGKERLLNDLYEAGFSYWCIDKAADMGLVYAYK